MPFRIDGKREFESKRFVSAGRNYNKISFDLFEKFVKKKFAKRNTFSFLAKERDDLKTYGKIDNFSIF